jgi:ribosome biogenesis GTPase
VFVDLKDYGFTAAEHSAMIHLGTLNGETIPGRVTQDRRDRYTVITQYGEIPAELKGSFYYTIEEREELPAVGDFVPVKYNPLGSSLITGVLPRRSTFSRADFSGHKEGYAKNIQEQVVASNFDYVFILCSLNYDFSVARISRYLTISWKSGGLPVVLLTKADLCATRAERAAEVRTFARDAPVIAISNKTGLGLDELAPFLEPGKTAVFLGSSGVGKSSLLNRLAGEKIMEVKEIREDDSKGRHTTTYRHLCRLPSGALVIDTPGMRELGLWDAGEAVSTAFAGVEDVISRCRFSNCTHNAEPGCAVLAALEDGSLSAETWKDYHTQRREATYVERRAASLMRKNEVHNSLSKQHSSKPRRKPTGGDDSDGE